MELKKSVDQSEIQRAADEALAQQAPPPGSPRRRGRQPGTKFPNGYKKNGAAPADTARPAGPAQDLPGGGPDEFNGGADDLGGGSPGASFALPSFTPMIEKLLGVAFNQLLVKRAGEHWALDEDEIATLAEPVVETLQELAPSMNNKWAMRASIVLMVLGPRMMRQYEINKANPKVKKPDATKQPAAPADPAQHRPDPRAPGAGQNDSLQTASSALESIPCDRRS